MNVVATELVFAKIQEEQERNGVKVDLDLLDKHIKTLKEMQEVLLKENSDVFGLVVDFLGVVKKPFKKDGTLSVYAKKYSEHLRGEIVGPFSKIEITRLSPSRRVKMAERLLTLGWKPTLFTETGQPKFAENGELCPNLSKMGNIGSVLAQYYKIQHRLGLLNSILAALRPDLRVPAKMNSCGTNTYRVTHKIVANIPKASPKVFFGKECREVFTVEEGNLMLGFDASGLEAVCMAHYTMPYDNGEFANLILEGDIHTYTQETLGLSSRDLAKGLRYALTYGAQVPKVQAILGCSKVEAQEIFDSFWESTPGLAKLRQKVIHLYQTKGYLPGLDGWIVRPRSEHSALNTLFQSAGAKIMKTAQILLYNQAKKEGLWFKKLIDYHDEGQFEVHKEDCIFKRLKEGEEPEENWCLIERESPDKGIKRYQGYHRLGELSLKALNGSGKLLKMRVPVTGEYKIGRNWAETH